MTKEINDIFAAYEAAKGAGRRTALATVVHVEGSSYRRPGARMLVEDNGKMTGAISGGCLEGDALRKALLAINQQQNKIVTYDTLHEDDMEFGVQLGCNGIVHILFEPVDPGQPNNPVALLQKSHAQRKDSVLVTLFSLKNYHGHQPGTCFLYDDGATQSNIGDKSLEAEVKRDALIVLANKNSYLKSYGENGLMGFVELLRPAVSLILAGAGNDALPIVDIAGILGWQTTIVDGRSTHANTQRFSKASRIIVAKPAEAMEQIPIDEQTVVVLMTHNYNYDLDMLQLLLKKDCRYIGTLGPKKRLERMLAELKDRGVDVSDEQRAGIYGPTGLDIGAEAAEEIALSLLAEIKAVLSARQGAFLRDRAEGIHERSTPLMNGLKT